MVSGMSGTETIYGPAIVGGTHVTFKKGEAPAMTNQEKLHQALAQEEKHTVDGVEYDSN